MRITWSIATATGVLASDQFDFAARGGGEIMQNVRTIVSTRRFTCQLDRKFGLDTSFQDRPINWLVTQALGAVITACHKYEPRAQVEDLQFDISDASNGHIKGSIFLKILTTAPYSGSWQPL